MESRMEIVGMERNSEWKIERKEENGWNIRNKTENTKATALITAVHRERYEILVERETSDTNLMPG